MERDQFLKPKQVAEALQVSQRTLYRLIQRGEIKAVRVGNSWRIRQSELEEIDKKGR